MKDFFRKTICRRTCLCLAGALLCVLCLAGCQGDSPDISETDGDRPPDLTLAPNGGVSAPDGALTLPSDGGEESEPAETAPLPGRDALSDDVDYASLVITACYAAGNMADSAMVDYSYIELGNPTGSPIPLAGVALYVAAPNGSFTEYAFPAGDTVPAGGYFLVRGRAANGESADVFTLTETDRIFESLAPDPRSLRVVLAPAESTLDPNAPIAGQADVFAYLSSNILDAGDDCHYVRRASSDDLIRKKAFSDKVDYQTLDLTDTSAATLALARPMCAAGDKNTAVRSQMAEVIFSHEGGIYDEGFDLTLTAPEGYTVYFSVNDTDPRAAGGMTYVAPLHLSDTTEMAWGRLTAAAGRYLGPHYDPLVSTFPGAAVVKAYAVRASDGATTPLTTQTYFIGELFRSWGADLVSLSLLSDDFLGPRGLYNNITQGVGSVREHAPAYVEFISPEGSTVHTGWCEIAMNGKGSLGMTQKSFRLLFKSEVMDTAGIGENLSTMGYDLFGKYASETPDGEPVTWFRHILLRNGGGDMSGSTISRSHIGDAYIQRIDRHLNPDIMAYAPAMVFVNGEFWGMYNARERLDSEYFEGKYGIPEEDLAVVECPYPLFYGWNVDYTEGAEDPEEAAYFMELVRFCQNNNMADPTNYQYIANRIDIDGLIDFYCAQIYLNCSDWPSNNIKIWRNTNPDHPTMDTRWHFCIVDTDHGVGLNSTVDQSLWGVISDGPVISRLVNHLLQSPTFRERFLMRYIWCIEVYFTPDRLTEELDALIADITPIMQYQLDRWRCTNGERTDWDKWYSYIEIIRDYVTRRPPIAKSQFMQWAGINEQTYRKLKNQAIDEWGSTVEE